MIYTSCWGRMRLIVARGLSPVSTARYAPDFFIGRVYMPLAPTQKNFGLKGAAFDAAYRAQLAKLDPVKVAADLGENAVLLCWEGDPAECHRALIAEWLTAAGVEVQELT